jgi:hypothetical protein
MLVKCRGLFQIPSGKRQRGRPRKCAPEDVLGLAGRPGKVALDATTVEESLAVAPVFHLDRDVRDEVEEELVREDLPGTKEEVNT